MVGTYEQQQRVHIQEPVDPTSQLADSRIAPRGRVSLGISRDDVTRYATYPGAQPREAAEIIGTNDRSAHMRPLVRTSSIQMNVGFACAGEINSQGWFSGPAADESGRVAGSSWRHGPQGWGTRVAS